MSESARGSSWTGAEGGRRGDKLFGAVAYRAGLICIQNVDGAIEYFDKLPSMTLKRASDVRQRFMTTWRPTRDYT